MWISDECSDADEGRNTSTDGFATITGDSTSYTIEDLSAATSYIITVTAFNAVSNASGSASIQTNEAGQKLISIYVMCI